MKAPQKHGWTHRSAPIRALTIAVAAAALCPHGSAFGQLLDDLVDSAITEQVESQVFDSVEQQIESGVTDGIERQV
ncbi:MAG: hypothetical protein JXB36_09625, partial [Gammaproteobacteria bacterium]|nr:hypothetical protein [Gammaproteobacteria bacterium]